MRFRAPPWRRIFFGDKPLWSPTRSAEGTPVFTSENTIDASPDQLAALNEQLHERLMRTDPNDYELRQKVEADFRAEVAARPKPHEIPPAQLPGARLVEHEGPAADDAGASETIAKDRAAAEDERQSRVQMAHEDEEAAAAARNISHAHAAEAEHQEDAAQKNSAEPEHF